MEVGDFKGSPESGVSCMGHGVKDFVIVVPIVVKDYPEVSEKDKPHLCKRALKGDCWGGRF